MIKPKYLKSKDKIAVVAPAGKIDTGIADFAKDKLESWGLRVILGEHVFNEHFQFAGTDEERLKDMQKALDDESTKAILCARGGYGLIRILDQLDFSKFKANPKWLIGFSDVTILHSYIQSRLTTETLHAPMAAGLKEDDSAEALRKALFGEPVSYELSTHSLSRPGNSSGILTGGNLAILCSLLGSDSDIDTKGKILFIEDIGEYLYRLDRMMWTLKRSGKLNHLAGLIVGDFSDMKDNDDPFEKSAYEIIADAVKEYDYPVCFGFLAGHKKENKTLILGRQLKLSIGEKTTLKFSVRGPSDKPKTQNPELRTSI